MPEQKESIPVLIVIPARGGSKGIPRKNMRPLGGVPLIAYSIQTALSCDFKPDVCVSSDDDEILSFAETLGARSVRRPADLSGDNVTLDPVVYHAARVMEGREGKRYELVITMQPTSPLLKRQSVEAALDAMVKDPSIDTVISAKVDAHLSWRKDGNGNFIPNYRKRLNRQELDPEYRETGGFFISRSRVVTRASRFGEKVSLYVLDGAETIDIDDYDDWNLCEYHKRRKKVLFVVSGYPEIGLGHAYNTLILANEILNHAISFLVDRRSSLAMEKIAASNYPVTMQSSENIIEDIERISPDVVINDRLDTDEGYVRALKGLGCTVVNFEDLGEGASLADLVINAIYPERLPREGHYYGHRYFALRDEFIRIPEKIVEPEIKEVLVTFGGVDQGNFTRRVLDEIYEECRARNIRITVIAGFGYRNYDSLECFGDVRILRDVRDISSRMLEADIIFTSAGRTTYEIAAVGTPAIVIAQNQRETSHFFASQEYGFLNLGLGQSLPRGALLEAFRLLAANYPLRSAMSASMKSVDLKHSKRNVIKLLLNMIEER